MESNEVLANRISELTRKNSELQAQVEQLKHIVENERDVFPKLQAVFNSTPAQCLAEVKSQAVKDALNHILSMTQTTHQSFLRNGRYIYVSNRALDEYANTIRNQKGGE